MKKYTYIGTLKIDDNLTLLNPSFIIKSIFYDLETQIYKINLIFTENDGIFKHFKSYTQTNDTPGQLTFKQVLDFINMDPILSQFTLS